MNNAKCNTICEKPGLASDRLNVKEDLQHNRTFIPPLLGRFAAYFFFFCSIFPMQNYHNWHYLGMWSLPKLRLPLLSCSWCMINGLPKSWTVHSYWSNWGVGNFPASISGRLRAAMDRPLTKKEVRLVYPYGQSQEFGGPVFFSSFVIVQVWRIFHFPFLTVIKSFCSFHLKYQFTVIAVLKIVSLAWKHLRL